MPVDFGLYSQKRTATSTPSRSMLSSKRCGTRVPSSSYSSRREGEPYSAAHSLQDSFRVGRRAAWTWASMRGMPSSKLPVPLEDHRDALPHPYAHRCEAVPHVGTPPHLVCTSVVSMRAPEAPRGCPSAIAPPLGFNLSSAGSIPHSWRTASACAANASYSSIRPTSSRVIPALSRAFLVAGTGPMPMTLGGTPATATLLIVAIGFRPCVSAY